MSDPTTPSIQYFVRRLTPELAADLVGPVLKETSDEKPETGWDRFASGARQMGVAMKELIGGLLFETKPRVPRAPRATVGQVGVRNLYGHFLVIEKATGELEICRDPDTYTFPKNANVYIVADLVGMPIARMRGVAVQTSLSVGAGSGQKTDAEYVIDLWLDPGDGANKALTDEARQRLGSFLSKVLAGRDSLTVEELVDVSRQRLQPFLQAMLDVPAPGKAWVMGQRIPDESALLGEAIHSFQQKASEYLGLTISVRFRPGTRVYRHTTFLSEETRQAAEQYAVRNWAQFDDEGNWKCPNPVCDSTNPVAMGFCPSCRTARPSATKEARADRSWKLVTKDGEDLNLEIEYVSYNTDAVDADGITAACIDALWKECRRIMPTDLESDEVLSRLNLVLNERLTTGRFGNIGEFSVVYFDTAETEWKRQVRARVRQQLREISEQTSQLEVTDGSLTLREMQLLRDQRDTDVLRQELSANLDRTKITTEHELAEERLAASTDVARGKLKIDTELEMRSAAAAAASEEMRFTRDVEQQARGYAREDAVTESTERRLDEMADLDHDLTKDDKVLAAQRKAEQDAAELQARIERMKASVKLDVSRDAQAIELDRKRQEQELELGASSVKSKLEIEKLRAMAEMEALQREQQSKMSAAQLLALQASSLAQNGALDALTQLASHDGQSAAAAAEAKVAKMQAEMLERMMAMQAQSQATQTDASQAAMAQQMQLMMMAMQQQQATSTAAMQANQEAIRAAMLGQQATNTRIQEAQQQTADAAVAWTDRTIGAMANVAATKAGNPGAPAVSPPPSIPSAGNGGAARFCTACGAAASAGAFCSGCGTRLPT